GPGKMAVRAINAEPCSTRREDLLELWNLIDQRAFTMDDLHFLYSMTIEAAYNTVRELNEEGKDFTDILLNLSLCVEIIFVKLLSIIDAADAIMRNEGIATPEALERHKRIHSIYKSRPDFIRKVVEAAFKDAPIRLAMESTLGYVRDVMDMTPASADTSGYYYEEEDDVDLNSGGGTMLN
ncbi:MAG: hypothetical protein AAB953_02315, partial [Patescibacteria group bacterium]